MEKQSFDFKKFIEKNKTLVGIYLIWFLLHFIFLMVGGGEQESKFVPFGTYPDIGDYDISEFLLYSIAPIIIFLIYYFLKDGIKKGLDND